MPEKSLKNHPSPTIMLGIMLLMAYDSYNQYSTHISNHSHKVHSKGSLKKTRRFEKSPENAHNTPFYLTCITIHRICPILPYTIHVYAAFDIKKKKVLL